MATPPATDALLRLMQQGDLAALDQLARTWGERLLAVAKRQCHLRADAEDAVQQALVAASTSMTGIRDEGSPLAWLSVLVARQCSRMNALAKQTEALGDDAVPCHCEDAQVVAERRELAERLNQALMGLSRTDRLVFLLSAEGFDGVELAERFGLSHDAIRGRLKRARQHLRVALGEVLEVPKTSYTGRHRVTP